MWRLRLPLLLTLAVAGCRYPADPEETLDRVEGGTLRVGLLTPADEIRDSPEGARLAAVARALDAELVLREGAAHALVEAVRRGEIDLLAGGLPEDISSDIGLSKPWGEAVVGNEAVPAVLGVRQGENAFLLAINRALAR